MNGKWLIVLTGAVFILFAEVCARTDTQITERDIIKSMLSPRRDWRVEGAMLRGTLTEVAFIAGLFAIVFSSASLVFQEKASLVTRGLAVVILLGSITFLCISVVLSQN